MLFGLVGTVDAKDKDKKTQDSVQLDVEFGIKMAQRGLWKEALFRFQQADLQQPNNSRLLNNIAVAYEAVGAYDKALETYKKGLQANASDRELKQNYSRFLEFYQAYKPEQPSEADRAAEQAAERLDQTETEDSEAATESEPATEEAESDGTRAEQGDTDSHDSDVSVAQSTNSPSSSSGQ